ncbi:MAG: cytochrome c biogenesis CcdA family protein [Micrococcales bacterium]|nr:cytochrome c biogenesis CcdA family protein [Micrococcales bacterium]MCL2667393.1 cytochrome c biogenesis CcdA family protein [Micrococcales bacterium]
MTELGASALLLSGADQVVTVPVALLAGVLAFASPCFLPVVPVFVGYLSGSGTTETYRGRGAAVAQASVFVGAFATVFIALYGLIGLVGQVLADRQSVLRVVGGSVVIVLGLNLLGLVRLPFLDRTLRVDYYDDMTRPPTVKRSVLLGLAFGAGWTPCIGPVLGGVLGLAAQSESVWTGLGLMVVFSLGLGLPFVAVCAGATGLTSRLRWFIVHRRGVEIVTGAMLVVIGFLIIANLTGRLAALLPSPV